MFRSSLRCLFLLLVSKHCLSLAFPGSLPAVYPEHSYSCYISITLLSRWGERYSKMKVWSPGDWKVKWECHLWRGLTSVKGTEWLTDSPEAKVVSFGIGVHRLVLGNILPWKVFWGSEAKISHYNSIILNMGVYISVQNVEEWLFNSWMF